jgi:hypothetical protein
MKVKKRISRESAERWNQRLTELVGQKARTHFSTERLLHLDRLHKWPVAYDQQDAWRAFLDTLPRKPYAFLAMVAAAERRRAVRATVDAKKAKGLAKYQRRFKQQPDLGAGQHD